MAKEFNPGQSAPYMYYAFLLTRLTDRLQWVNALREFVRDIQV